MRTIRTAVALSTLGALLMSTDLTAADKPKPPEPGKAIPAETPLSVTVQGTAEYAIDPTTKSEAELKQGFAADRFPNPPKVDLKLVVKNTGTQAVQVWAGGDPVTVDLELTGQGVVKVVPQLMMTTDFRSPKVVTIEAGKSLELPLKALAGGMRGLGHYVYWTGPGKYELVATLNTAVSPAPKGADETDDGFGKVRVASPKFAITVVDKK